MRDLGLMTDGDFNTSKLTEIVKLLLRIEEFASRAAGGSISVLTCDDRQTPAFSY